MSFVRLTFILLFWSAPFLTLTSCENDGINLENGVEAFLNHLKAQDMVYGYKNAEVLDVQQKKDVLQLTIIVEGECLNIIPQMPCKNTVRECTAYILKEENTENLMVKNVKCTDKLPGVSDSVDEELVYEPPQPESGNNGFKKIELSHETVSTEAEEPFVAVRKNQCCGFATDVDTNIEGVDTLVDTALRQVEADKEKRHALVKIVRLQKQVVAGIKYILTMEIAPTTCEKNAELSVSCPIDESAETVTCQVEFIEKVWISKDKHIIFNNCTTTRFYDVPEVPERVNAPKNDIENEINHGSGKPGDLPNISVEGLSDIESQIIPDQSKSSSNQIIHNKAEPQNRDDDVLRGIESMIEPINVRDDYTPPLINLHKQKIETIPEEPLIEPINVRDNYNAPPLINLPKQKIETIPEEPLIEPINVRDNYNAPPLTNLHKQKIETIPEEPFVKSQYIDAFELPPQDYFHKVEEKDQPYKNRLHSNEFYNPSFDFIPPNRDHFDEYSNPIIDLNIGLPRPENQFDPFSPEVSNYNPVDHSDIDDLLINVDQDTYKPMYFDDFAGAFPELFVNDAPVPEKPTEVATTQTPETSSPLPESSSKKPEDTNAKKTTSSEEKSSEENSNAAESKGSSEEKMIKKRDVNNNDANDDDDSSSSSSSSSDEEKKDSKDNEKDEVDCPKKSKKGNKNKKDDDDDDNNNNNDKNESSSSSSSSSSESDDNDNNHNDDDDNNHKKHKRSLGQLEKISVHEKPLVRDLADYVAATLDYKDEDNHRNVVLQILGAKKLKLEGLYYNLILRLGISHCFEDKHANSEECREKLFENLTKICKVQVHVDEEYSNPKIVKSQCQNIKKDEFDINRTNYSRYRRQSKGGIKERPVDDPEALQHLKTSLSQMDSESGHPNKLKVKKVLAVSSQVVAGTLWKIKAIVVLSDCKHDEIKDIEQCGELEGADTRICNFSIWDRPWLQNGKETEVKCDNEKELYKYRAKRQLAGGKTEQPKDSAEALKHLKKSLSLLDSESGHSNKLKIKEVISVKSQVVSGISWDIKAKVIISDCKKEDTKDSQECGELSGAEEKICDFNIWEQPWLPQGTKTEIKCENESKTHKFRSKRETIPGGKTEHPKNSEQALTHLKKSLSQLDSESGHANKLKIKEVISVQSQVVSGVSWDIKAKIIYSDCKKEDPKDSQECGELSGAEEKICDFNIWDQPWLPQGTKTEIKCENESKTHKFRSKRETQQLLGGQTEQSKDNEQALKHLKNSLNQLDSESGHSNKLKIKEVISVKSQVVSGISWDIKAKVIVSDCKKEDPKDSQECGELSGAEEKICDFNIWDQPWLPQGTKTEIKCENESKTHKFRSKRETQQLLGGQTEQSKDNEQALKHLKNSLSQLDSESGHSNKLKIKEVMSVKSQVVSGISWDIKAKVIVSDCKKEDPKDSQECGELSGAEEKICDFNIWDQPWLPQGTKTEIKCENESKTHKFRSKRETLQLIGGKTEQSKDNEQALKYLKNSLSQLDSESEHSNKLKIKEVISVQSQVVSGISWNIKAKVIVSDCKKEDPKDSQECGELRGAEEKICDFNIWDQPWLPKGTKTQIKCENDPKKYFYRSKRELHQLGRADEQPIDNPKALGYVRDGLFHLDTQSDQPNKFKIKEILSVTKQIVSGQLWKIKAKIVLSDCVKDDPREPMDCGELESDEGRICVFQVHDQPWLPHGRATEIRCENEPNVHKYKSKRSVGNKYWFPSSAEGESISNPEVYEYVQSALEYLDSRSDKDTTYALREIAGIKKKAEDTLVISVSILISDCAKGTDARYCKELSLGSKACDISISSLNRSGSRREISIKCEGDDNVYAFKDISSTNGLTQEEIRTLFSKFINHHNKNYKHKNEYNYRFKVFQSNLKIIDELNKQEQGTGEYGITKFADLTPEEFSRSHGLRSDLRSDNDIPFAQAKIPDIELPVEFDWRQKGAVTEVKDQGQCGSCWAFSVTGNVEGQNAINGGTLQELSEQELVDCDTMDEGCNGGLMDNAYRMIEKLGGLELEQDYPYDARDEKCHFNKNKVRVQLSGAVNISHDESDMAKWLVQNGPISIAINANAMQFYVGGVSHPWKMLCNPKNLDHGVLIVGYGVHKYPLFNKTMPYWIVKNSWGKSWGEQGYYRVYRGDGTCGLNQTPSSAIVTKLE